MKTLLSTLAALGLAVTGFAGITTGPTTNVVNLVSGVNPTIIGGVATNLVEYQGTNAGATLTGTLTNRTVRALTQGWYTTTGTPVTNGAQAQDVTLVFTISNPDSSNPFGATIVQTNGFDGSIETNKWSFQNAISVGTITMTETWKGTLYSNDVVNLINTAGTTTVLYSSKKAH